jgi:glucose-6-phosphate 1-epimerase
MWSLDGDPSPLPAANNQSSVDLILKSAEEDLKTWPRRYALELCGILFCVDELYDFFICY